MIIIDVRGKDFRQAFKQVKRWFLRNPNRKHARLQFGDIRQAQHHLVKREDYVSSIVAFGDRGVYAERLQQALNYHFKNYPSEKLVLDAIVGEKTWRLVEIIFGKGKKLICQADVNYLYSKRKPISDEQKISAGSAEQ